MRVEIHHVPDPLEVESTVVVDIYDKDLVGPVSYIAIKFYLSTALRLTRATNPLFSNDAKITKSSPHDIVSSPSSTAYLEKKDNNGKYTAVKLESNGFIVRAEFSVLRKDIPTEVRVEGVIVSEDPSSYTVSIPSGIQLIFR